MKWNNLERIGEAPGRGMVLLYLRTEVIFKPYDSLLQVKERVADNDILEMHLFDDQKEYRALVSESPRFKEKNGCIEWIAKFDTKGCYCDETIIEEDDSQMTVVNHINFNEVGMAEIDDYRLVMGKV